MPANDVPAVPSALLPNININGSPNHVTATLADALLEHGPGHHAVLTTTQLAAYKSVALVTMPVFMAYACLFALQGKVRRELGITCSDCAAAHEFGAAVSSLYVGNLTFRLAHNVVFSALRPHNRALLAMGCLMGSLSLISIGVFRLGIHNTALVSLAYFLGGVGVGTFEPSLLSAVAPLGARTTMWATLGIPLGIVCVTVGSFVLMGPLGVAVTTIYASVVALLGLGMLTLAFCIPYTHTPGNGGGVRAFYADLRDWRLWLPQIRRHAAVLAIDMFCVSAFSPGVLLYVFSEDVALWGDTTVSHDLFFAVYDLGTFLGGMTSRRLAYIDPVARDPLSFLPLLAMGVVINCYKYAPLCPLGGFLIFFANGSIYNHTCKQIDQHVGSALSLTALSFWLFLGDFGSVGGSNIMPYLRVWVGAGRA